MERLQFLFQKYLNNHILADEFAEMWQLLAQEQAAGNLTPQLQQLWQQKPQYNLSNSYWNKQFKAFKQANEPVIVKHPFRWNYAAAAIFIAMLGLGYLLFNKTGAGNGHKATASNALVQDVQPGATGAILVFDNGSTIVLDTAQNGKLTEAVEKTNEHITVSSAKLHYATLSTPRARQQQLILADGSKVWLNAASSIRFPSVFSGNTREVEITGEAYFEVAPSTSAGGTKQPFIVHANGQKVEVLGTHFNIMAYINEAALQTTLLEGSIKLTAAAGGRNKAVTLLPGQQALLQHASANGEILVINNADIDIVMAWKNGLQQFKQAGVASIMRQVERWYDVDVEYKTPIPPNATFSGELPRNINLSQLLRVFESSGLKFSIDGNTKKVTVSK
jgi:transmembrane sensor